VEKGFLLILNIHCKQLLSVVAFLQNVPKDDTEKSQNLLHKL